jgi:hypothetical protein
MFSLNLRPVKCQRAVGLMVYGVHVRLFSTSLNRMSPKSTLLQKRIWSPGRRPASRAIPPSFVNWTKMPGFHSGPLQILETRRSRLVRLFEARHDGTSPKGLLCSVRRLKAKTNKPNGIDSTGTELRAPAKVVRSTKISRRFPADH